MKLESKLIEKIKEAEESRNVEFAYMLSALLTTVCSRIDEALETNDSVAADLEQEIKQ